MPTPWQTHPPCVVGRPTSAQGGARTVSLGYQLGVDPVRRRAIEQDQIDTTAAQAFDRGSRSVDQAGLVIVFQRRHHDIRDQRIVLHHEDTKPSARAYLARDSVASFGVSPDRQGA